MDDPTLRNSVLEHPTQWQELLCSLEGGTQWNMARSWNMVIGNTWYNLIKSLVTLHQSTKFQRAMFKCSPASFFWCFSAFMHARNFAGFLKKSGHSKNLGFNCLGEAMLAWAYWWSTVSGAPTSWRMTVFPNEFPTFPAVDLWSRLKAWTSPVWTSSTGSAPPNGLLGKGNGGNPWVSPGFFQRDGMWLPRRLRNLEVNSLKRFVGLAAMELES